ncbi:MAG: phosphatidylserine/phosphatidylglycerophosphate/cardiolipin synthase family protein [Gemmatirosa sp.]|nr:phosphatidylserine/phosphatidylglycerophosphate/cardiolipin synthase family protein [Gemmatirosa sp.]
MPFVDTGSYPTRDGNRVVPWIDGEPAFRRICEAIDAARRSVWVTVTFMWASFRMPDGRGTALDVLERAAQGGLDVRLLCWRPDDETAEYRLNAFWGSAAHRALLDAHHPRVDVRWDRAHPGFCQHQKSWLIDAGEDDATAFVGGINLNPHSMVAPGHRGAHHNHDVYVEVTGPAVADVHHNFVQRWNEASERALTDGRRGPRGDDDLPFPTHAPPPRGAARVQIQRTTHAGRYTDGHAPPGGSPFAIARGERTNLAQYRAAIAAARRTIYLEHQSLDVAEIVDALDDALARGVHVVALMPAAAPERAAAIALRARLAAHERFALCGIAGPGPDGRREPVHVHSKLMLVDDAWATVGSCNLHRASLFGNGELNAAFSDPATVRAVRLALFHEHLDADTSALSDTDALLLFRHVARENRRRHDRGDPHWQGLAFVLDADANGQRT